MSFQLRRLVALALAALALTAGAAATGRTTTPCARAASSLPRCTQYRTRATAPSACRSRSTRPHTAWSAWGSVQLIDWWRAPGCSRSRRRTSSRTCASVTP